MQLIRSPVGLFEEIMAVFQKKKSQNDKSQKQKSQFFSIFKGFFAFFVEISSNYMN